jgi:hypothetical protein
MQEKDKKRQRFKYEDDVVLLREVVSRNPFSNGCAVWEEIKNNVMQVTQKELIFRENHSAAHTSVADSVGK